jgi:hypothetical protein
MIRPGKYGHRLTREMYALVNKKSSVPAPERMSDELREYLSRHYEDAELTILTDEFCHRQREAALENFDLNMAFFAQIPQADFEEALQGMLAKNKRLRPVTDLKTLDDEWGVYVLVLDEYRQAYIGQSSWDMRKRIKAHWNGTKQFDRLLWGGVEESVMSIDSFRALDTTRVFAARTINYDALESRLVRSFPPDYLLNRIGGGAVTGLRAMFIGAEMKRRRLIVDPGTQDP